MDVALDRATGENFQPSGRDRTLNPAADDYRLGLDASLHPTFGADRDVGAGFDIAFDLAVDVQLVV